MRQEQGSPWSLSRERLEGGHSLREVVLLGQLWLPLGAFKCCKQAPCMEGICMKGRMASPSYPLTMGLIEKRVKAHIQANHGIVKTLYFLALLNSTNWAVDIDGVCGL